MEEVRTLRRAMGCFFSIDALENYMRRVFEEVESNITSEAVKEKERLYKLMSFPVAGGLTGLIDDYLLKYGILPEELKAVLYVLALAGVLIIGFLWFRIRLTTLEKLRDFARERSFVAGELISYIRSFTGARFSMEVPVRYEQIPDMITMSWLALGLYFSESYGIELLKTRLLQMISLLREALLKKMEALEKEEIFLGLPPEARRPFHLLKSYLAEA